MEILHLKRSVFDALRAHGEQTYPYECCGALLGRNVAGRWQVEQAVRTGNIRTASARTRYEIAPVELVGIQRAASRQNLEIAGFYHSHPDHPAQWSPTDLADAHWVGCVYVITEVNEGKAAATNSFLLSGTTETEKRFEQQVIRIEDCIAEPPS